MTYPIYLPVSNRTTMADLPTPGAPTNVTFIAFSCLFSTFDKLELEWCRRMVKVFRFKKVTWYWLYNLNITLMIILCGTLTVTDS